MVSLFSKFEWIPVAQLNWQNLGTQIYLLYCAFILLQLVCFATSLLMMELFFPLQVITALLGFALRGIGFFVHNIDFTPLEIPLLFWTTLVIFGVIYSSTRYRAHFFPWKVSRRMRPLAFPPRTAGRHRILLIEPTMQKDFFSISQRRNYYPFTTPYLASLMPEDWDVMILDCLYNEIDYELDVDIVALTSMSVHYKITKEIAEAFREKGRTVIFGGSDPSRQPDQYLRFSDSVLVGNAEEYLPLLLDDWKNGQLKKRYVNPTPHHLRNMPIPRYDLLPLRRYTNIHMILVSTSCPFHCDFCSYNRTREPRLRPPEEVLAAIRATPSKYFWFEAPELLAYKPYIRELKKVLAGTGIHWATHASMRSCADENNLKEAYAAGLRQVWLGVESYNQEALHFLNKKMNIVGQYESTFALLDKIGISAGVHLIFGSPMEVADDYRKTLVALVKAKVALVWVHLLAIHAGDEEFEKKIVAHGGREFDIFKRFKTREVSSFSYYRPKSMTDLEMAEAYDEFCSGFYSIGSIFRRICFRSLRNFPNFFPDLFSNIVYLVSRRSVGADSFYFYAKIDETFDLARGTTEQVFRGGLEEPTKEPAIEQHF